MAGILRGEIRWAELNPARGNEQSDLRPVLVLSHDVFNERSGTVIAAALTSQPQKAGFPLTLQLESTALPDVVQKEYRLCFLISPRYRYRSLIFCGRIELTVGILLSMAKRSRSLSLSRLRLNGTLLLKKKRFLVLNCAITLRNRCMPLLEAVGQDSVNWKTLMCCQELLMSPLFRT